MISVVNDGVVQGDGQVGGNRGPQLCSGEGQYCHGEWRGNESSKSSCVVASFFGGARKDGGKKQFATNNEQKTIVGKNRTSITNSS